MADLNSLVEQEMKLFHDRVVDKYEYLNSWIDAVVEVCEEMGVDVEDATGMICPSIISRLQIEAESKKMIKAESRNTVRLD